MRKPSTRKIVAAPATAATSAKPVKAAKAAIVAAIEANPVNARLSPESKTILADAGLTAVPAAVPAVAKPSANITRTAATVARQATNYATLSERDSAYLSFYAKLAKASVLGNVTLAGIVASGERPGHAGSNKPHDAGVIVRLTKAGLITHSDGGHGFAFTDLGKSHREYTGVKTS